MLFCSDLTLCKKIYVFKNVSTIRENLYIGKHKIIKYVNRYYVMITLCFLTKIIIPDNNNF